MVIDLIFHLNRSMKKVSKDNEQAVNNNTSLPALISINVEVVERNRKAQGAVRSGALQQ